MECEAVHAQGMVVETAGVSFPFNLKKSTFNFESINPQAFQALGCVPPHFSFSSLIGCSFPLMEYLTLIWR
jgi:5-methylthioribose kinase